MTRITESNILITVRITAFALALLLGFAGPAFADGGADAEAADAAVPEPDAAAPEADMEAPEPDAEPPPADVGAPPPPEDMGAPPQSGGLLAQYFNGTDFQELGHERVDRRVQWVKEGERPIAPGVGPDNITVRWKAFVRPRYSERYTFRTRSDDGVRLWVDGKRIINNWTPHGATDDTGGVELEAEARVPLMLEYYQGGGGAVIELHWRSESQGEELIGAGRLDPEDPLPSSTTVSLEAIDSRATEGSTDAARLVVQRYGPLDEALEVTLQVGGDAEEGKDYEAFERSIRFRPHVSTVHFDISALDDQEYTGQRKIEISLGEGDYEVGEQSEATVSIGDDERLDPSTSYSVNGQIEYRGARSGAIVVALYTDDAMTEEQDRVILFGSGVYGLSGLPAGDYTLIAFLDEDEDGAPGEGELRGTNADEESVIALTLPPDAVGHDFTIVDPDAPEDGGESEGDDDDGCRAAPGREGPMWPILLLVLPLWLRRRTS